MVLFHLTAGLESRLRSLDLPAELSAIVLSHVSRGENDEAGADEELATEKPRPKSTAKTIDHTVLVRVARHYRMLRERSSCTLASLLALTDIYAPSLPVREKSAELLAILADMQLQQDRASYARMTQSSSSNTSLFPSMDDPAYSNASGEASPGDWKEIRRQVTAIVNVMASMATVATGVWWVGGGRSVGARLGLSMSGAAAIAAIEAFLYYRFFTRHDRERDFARRRKVAAASRQAKVESSARSKPMQ